MFDEVFNAFALACRLKLLTNYIALKCNIFNALLYNTIKNTVVSGSSKQQP